MLTQARVIMNEKTFHHLSRSHRLWVLTPWFVLHLWKTTTLLRLLKMFQNVFFFCCELWYWSMKLAVSRNIWMFLFIKIGQHSVAYSALSLAKMELEALSLAKIRAIGKLFQNGSSSSLQQRKMKWLLRCYFLRRCSCKFAQGSHRNEKIFRPLNRNWNFLVLLQTTSAPDKMGIWDDGVSSVLSCREMTEMWLPSPSFTATDTVRYERTFLLIWWSSSSSRC